MIKRVLIIGGYGNFGRFICKQLACDENIRLIIAGRSQGKAEALIQGLVYINKPETLSIDISQHADETIKAARPDILIHTSGPFQNQDYSIAKICIENNIHYIDIADGRDFVSGFSKLHDEATKANILAISGASSVPALTSSIIENYKAEFNAIKTVDYSITTAQRATPGLATTKAILSYLGRPFKTLTDGEKKDIYGWQGLKMYRYKVLGHRLLSHCDIPDLELFPKYYPNLKTIRFSAGLELPFIHLSLWVLSCLVRLKPSLELTKYAEIFLRLFSLFNMLGSDESAFHLLMSGKSKDNKRKEISFEMTACSGHGVYIPCVPAILLAKKLTYEKVESVGAYPCIGFISLSEYLDFLSDFDISWSVEDSELDNIKLARIDSLAS